MNFVGWLRHAVRSAWFWITIWVVVVAVAACVISIMYWDWLNIRESNGSTIRNIVLAAVAVIALPLAIWRSIVAEKQAETAQRGLLNERYQKGAEMLGSAVLSVRLGGIYALDRLAKNHADDHHIQIMCLFSAFIRDPPKDQGKDNAANDEKVQNNSSGLQDPNPKVREDIQAVMECLVNPSDGQLKIEDREGYILNLRNADLSGVSLMEADLFWASLWDVNLRHAHLVRADLCYATLWDADLSHANLGRANLTGADLSGASLWGTNLSEADLSGTNLSYSDFVGAKLPKDLTQDQLDRAVADPDNPPILTDVKDRKTGKPLVWRGASTEQISREDGAETAARRLSGVLGWVLSFRFLPFRRGLQ